MSDDATTVGELRRLVEAFVDQRDWQQFHAPKNLSMALAIEAAELMEHFQWLDVDESRATADDADAPRGDRRRAGRRDVLCGLAMANALGIDVADAVREEDGAQCGKYPADEFRGRWGRGDKRSTEGE